MRSGRLHFCICLVASHLHQRFLSLSSSFIPSLALVSSWFLPSHLLTITANSLSAPFRSSSIPLRDEFNKTKLQMGQRVLTAQLMWLRDNHPQDERVRRILADEWYAAHLAAGKKTAIVGLKWGDHETIPALLHELKCPDFSNYGFPYLDSTNMPQPLDDQRARLIGNVPQFVKTTHPLSEQFEPKMDPGDAFDLAAAESFRLRPEGRNASIERNLDHYRHFSTRPRRVDGCPPTGERAEYEDETWLNAAGDRG